MLIILQFELLPLGPASFEKRTSSTAFHHFILVIIEFHDWFTNLRDGPSVIDGFY